MTLAAFPLLSLFFLASPAPAQSKRAPLTLSARLELHHMMRDMMTVLTSDYQVDVSLRIDASERAELRLQGTLEIHQAEIPVPGAAQRSNPPPRKIPVDARWTGNARRLNDHLVLHFENSTDYRPPLAVDVEWECAPHRVTVGAAQVAAWRCATSQSMTQRVGAGHHLSPYMQVETILAAPSENLHVAAQARGGADHRSSLQGMTFTKQPHSAK
jgi:hypothetical protein